VDRIAAHPEGTPGPHKVSKDKQKFKYNKQADLDKQAAAYIPLGLQHGGAAEIESFTLSPKAQSSAHCTSALVRLRVHARSQAGV
jgi:hypothetical protein